MTLCYRCDESFTPTSDNLMLCNNCKFSLVCALKKSFDEFINSDTYKSILDGSFKGDVATESLSRTFMNGFKEWDKDVMKRWVKKKFLK